MSKSAAYEAAGVNLEAGNITSDHFFEVAKTTWSNRAGEFGEPQEISAGFSGTRGVDMDRLFALKQEYPGARFIQYHCSDGAGNKPKVAQRMDKHDTIGIDLTAMVSDDAAAMGAEPIALVTNFVVNTLSKSSDSREKQHRIGRRIRELAVGYAAGANQAGMVIENGEVAEHGDSVGGYGEFRYDWEAMASWMALEDRLIDGSKIQPGDAIVAFKEDGFRCNGFSLVLKTLEDVYGHEWHHEPFGEDSTWGSEVLRPSRIYAGVMVGLTGGYHPGREPAAEVRGMAHVTGGGIPEKLGRVLPDGMGARLHNLYKPSDAMREIQRLTDIDDEEMYNVFNMGQGAMIITPEPKKVIKFAQQKGIKAKEAGFVTNEPEINLESKGLQRGWLRIVDEEDDF